MIQKSYGTGTLTGLNALLYRLFAPGRSADRDLAEFHAGKALRVYCGTYDIGTSKANPVTGLPVRKTGYLILQKGQPVIWEVLLKSERIVVAGRAPLQPSVDAGSPSILSRLGFFLLDTPEGTVDLSIPTADLELVEQAFASAPTATSTNDATS